METYKTLRHAVSASALTLLLGFTPGLAGCGGGAKKSDGNAAQAGTTQPGASGGGAAVQDAAGLDAEIGRLERQAERNPADDETRDELARAYVRRGNSLRGAGQVREALADYQRALRLDPDNDEAQNNAFATTQQLGGEQQGENGEPAPPAITPNVADEAERPAPAPKKQ